ncbi:MAG: hypothetical protein GY849_00655 [Deltaproteobacteria bacterium]|nr:hypothetical protein [Deltaproteobacteria bacterium]
MEIDKLAKQLLEKLKEENNDLEDGYFNYNNYGADEILLLYLALRKFLELY